jgi:hypothetical protein
MEKRNYGSGTVVLSYGWKNTAATANEVMEKCIVVTGGETRWYNSSHANECVDVEHEEKSLDY